GIRILTDVVPKYGLLDGAADIETIFDRTSASVKGVGRQLGDILGGADAASVGNRTVLPRARDVFNSIKDDTETSKLRQYGAMHRITVGLSKEEEVELNSLPKIVAEKKAFAEELEAKIRKEHQEASQLGGKTLSGKQFDKVEAAASIKAARRYVINSLRRQSQLNRYWDSSELG